MAGEYRKIIKESSCSEELKDMFNSHVLEIALSNSIVGNIDRVNKHNNVLIDIFTNSTDPKALGYKEGILSGRIQVVTTSSKSEIEESPYKNNGELYFNN